MGSSHHGSLLPAGSLRQGGREAHFRPFLGSSHHGSLLPAGSLRHGGRDAHVCPFLRIPPPASLATPRPCLEVISVPTWKSFGPRKPRWTNILAMAGVMPNCNHKQSVMSEGRPPSDILIYRYWVGKSQARFALRAPILGWGEIDGEIDKIGHSLARPTAQESGFVLPMHSRIGGWVLYSWTTSAHCATGCC